MSAFMNSSGQQAEGLESGGDGYITCPISNRELVARVKSILRLKQAEDLLAVQAAELARSNAELEKFAYIASHDLQEPLRMITSYLYLLEHRYKDKLDTDAQDFINYAVDGAARMRRLIDGLLQYSRVNTQGQSFETVDCHMVLEQALANLQLTIAEEKATITHEPLPTLPGDAGQLVQLFQNLIGNALKYRGDEAPQIHILAEDQGSHWQFAVRDNGLGIDPKDADRIFELFQRLHTTQTYSGTGLGLAICKKITERHGGRIWVESTPGLSSTFYFTLLVA
jgi:light-regulated signal transduction histidine kinase (bacteriophytochrome)